MGRAAFAAQRPSPVHVAILLTLCHLVAIAVFLKGYLLTRFELPNVSRCRNPELSWYNSHIKDVHNQSSCWSEPAFDRTVVFIVDALRIDFVFGGSLPPGMPKLLHMLHEAVRAVGQPRRASSDSLAPLGRTSEVKHPWLRPRVRKLRPPSNSSRTPRRSPAAG